MREKTDFTLGRAVRQHLATLALESPQKPVTLSSAVYTQKQTENAIASILRGFLPGFECDDSTQDTPKRVAAMLHEEMFYGLDYNNFPRMMVVDNKISYSSMLLERNIEVFSCCEHHLLSFFGKAHVAYIPYKKVAGLSKLNRVVDFFSRRPQIQERLTEQIYATLAYLLETDNVAVMIQCEHLCVKSRGVRDRCSDTVSSKLGGIFQKPEVRAEFFNLIGTK